MVVTEKQRTEAPSEKSRTEYSFYRFSEHPAFYDRQLNDRYTDLSFALGNKLLGILDEKQHREREGDKISGGITRQILLSRLLSAARNLTMKGGLILAMVRAI